MKTLKALSIVIISGLLFFSTQAKAVAIDILTVNQLTLDLDLGANGTTDFTLGTPVTPPAIITMGLFQDPILSFSPGLGITASVYTTGGLGDPAPTGTVNEPNTGDIGVDLSSLRARVNIPVFLPNADFSLWPLTLPPSMGTFDDLTGDFALSWDVDFAHGGINHIVTVSLAGTVTVVPVPAAIWLLGSGLIGLIAVGRRHC